MCGRDRRGIGEGREYRQRITKKGRKGGRKKSLIITNVKGNLSQIILLVNGTGKGSVE